MFVCTMQRHFVFVKPSDFSNLGVIKLQLCTSITAENVPERNVSMARCLSHGLCDRHEYWPVFQEFTVDEQFLCSLAQDGVPWMFARIYMPTGRKP